MADCCSLKGARAAATGSGKPAAIAPRAAACSSKAAVRQFVIGISQVLGSSELPASDEQLRDWTEEANDTLALLLAERRYVEVFDPVWGRNGVLLPAVLTALAGVDAGG